MRENINKEQITKIVVGAKIIAEALSISTEEVFMAMRDQGNITSDEAFALKLISED